MTRPDHTPDDPRVFVFGSNLLGVHGAGAARYAREQLGAKPDAGEGPMGSCYALPTCSAPGKPLLLDRVAFHVRRFLAHASTNRDVRFYVSPIGCGIAGFNESDIAPLFVGASDNCDLPDGWQ